MITPPLPSLCEGILYLGSKLNNAPCDYSSTSLIALESIFYNVINAPRFEHRFFKSIQSFSINHINEISVLFTLLNAGYTWIYATNLAKESSRWGLSAPTSHRTVRTDHVHGSSC
jgi:hypothetical protein